MLFGAQKKTNKGNGRSTRHLWWVIKPIRRTARHFFFFYTNSSTPYLNICIVFVTGEDDITRSDSQRYSKAVVGFGQSMLLPEIGGIDHQKHKVGFYSTLV